MGKYKRCIIVSGSPKINIAKLENHINIVDTDYIIACDSGYSHCERLGLTPDLVVGDFDSYHGDIDNEINEDKTKVIKVAAEKDDTDTMLAVKLGLQQGIKDFVLLEAMGGRTDHAYANIVTAVYAVAQGAACKIVSDTEEIYALRDGKINLNNKKGTVVSVFSYSEISEGVTYTGMKYELLNAKLTNDFPLGISNEITSDIATIEVKNGTLLVIVNL